jgi:transposase
MRCSSDIRKRVLDFVASGGSKIEAARRFQVSRASVYNWLSKEDGLSYLRPGPRHPRKLDWDALRQYIQDHPDLMLKEYAEHFSVSSGAVWKACHRMKLTYKKRRGVTGKRDTTGNTGAGT